MNLPRWVLTLAASREWRVPPWEIEEALDEDPTRDLWMDRRALFADAEHERYNPEKPKSEFTHKKVIK